MVNRLLTKIVRVNIPPAAESQLIEKGETHEEEYSGSLELLDLAFGWWDDQHRFARLSRNRFRFEDA